MVEIHKKPKFRCTSKQGRLTGLEPVTRINRWHPMEGYHKDRPEGEYFLLQMPKLLEADFPIPIMHPNQTALDAYKNLRKQMKDFCPPDDKETDEERVNTEWNDFFSSLIPPFKDKDNEFSDVLEFCKKNHTPKLPLLPILKIHQMQPKWQFYDLSPSPTINIGREWPKRQVVSNVSVVSNLNPSGGPPTLPLSDEDSLVYEYKQLTNQSKYYSEYLYAQTLNVLRTRRHRLIDFNGKPKTLKNGKKDEVLLAIQQDDSETILIRFQQLNVDELTAVNDLIDLKNEDANYHESVCCISGCDVTRDDLSDLSPQKPLRKAIMNAIIHLFTEREGRIQQCFYDDDEAESRKKSIFLDPYFFDWSFHEDESPNIDAVKSIFNKDIFKAYQMFIPVHCGHDEWFLVRISLSKEFVIEYFNPRFDGNSPFPNEIAKKEDTLIKKIELGVMAWLRVAASQCSEQESTALPPLNNNWELKRYGCKLTSPLYEKVTNNFDSGLAVVLAMDLLNNELPLYFKTNHLNTYRQNLCYWILKETYPI